MASVWSVSLDRVHAQAPAAEALLCLCAFLAPDIPRGLPTEQPQVLPADLAAVVGDRLAYNRTLAAIGRYSLATVTADTIGLHRLVQAVIQARLGEAGERAVGRDRGRAARGRPSRTRAGRPAAGRTVRGCCRTCSPPPGTPNDFRSRRRPQAGLPKIMSTRGV